MNNHRFKKGTERLRGMRLAETQKLEMLARLREYASQHAVTVTAPDASTTSPFWSKIAGFFKSPYGYALAGFALLFALGGVSYAAEGALPGDLLYLVKVNVNEPLREATLVTQSAKDQWEAQKLDRRLKEVEELAAQGRLDDRHVAEAEKRIDKQFERAEAKQGPAKAEEKVDKTIREHKAILENIKKPDDAKHNEKIERIEKKLEEKSQRKDSGKGKKQD